MANDKVEELRDAVAKVANLVGFSVTDGLSSDLGPVAEAVTGRPIEGVEPLNLLEIGLELLGLDEDDDTDALMKAFSDAGIICDPSTTHWCAAYVDWVLYVAGIGTLGSLAAKDFFKVGQPSVATTIGDLECWRNHVAINAGYVSRTKLLEVTPDSPMKITSVEQLNVCRCRADDPDAIEMVLGGNQSDMVNISPKEWYGQFSQYLGARRVLAKAV